MTIDDIKLINESFIQIENRFYRIDTIANLSVSCNSYTYIIHASFTTGETEQTLGHVQTSLDDAIKCCTYIATLCNQQQKKNKLNIHDTI